MVRTMLALNTSAFIPDIQLSWAYLLGLQVLIQHVAFSHIYNQ